MLLDRSSSTWPNAVSTGQAERISLGLSGTAPLVIVSYANSHGEHVFCHCRCTRKSEVSKQYPNAARSPLFSYTLTKKERGTGHEIWRIKSFGGCTTKDSIQMKNERTKGSMDIWHIKFFFNCKWIYTHWEHYSGFGTKQIYIKQVTIAELKGRSKEITFRDIHRSEVYQQPSSLRDPETT